MRYVLITPARNEERIIERTIKSVIAQTVQPHRWIIVNDGSTDKTDQIVSSYASRYSWIHLISVPEHNGHNFGAKVRCFESGLNELRHDKYEIIGNLDADLTFESDYFEYLMDKFSADPHLGVGGTPFVEANTKIYDYRFTNIEHVSGACQLFRRECFEDIGGYIPIASGGIDWVAVTTARMKGWKTRTFTGRTIVHRRAMGTGGGKVSGYRFRLGMKDYNLGNGAIWELFRSLYQMRYWPVVFGGLAMLAGYLWALIRHQPRPISSELIQFSRREQKDRLRVKFTRFMNRN